MHNRSTTGRPRASAMVKASVIGLTVVLAREPVMSQSVSVEQASPISGITVGADTGGTVVSIAGTSGDRRLTGLASGIAADDAVTVGQISSIVSMVTSAVSMVPFRANNSGAGATTSATGINALATGYGARASGTAGSAYGFGAIASGPSSTALGSEALASAANTVALGAGSIADVDDTISVGTAGGERRIVNVAAGAITDSSTDAVTGAQLYAVGQQASAAQAAAVSAQSDAAGAQALATIANGNAVSAQSTAATALSRTDYIAISGAGALPAVSGQGAVAIGTGQIANGAGAVAIGDPNSAAGTGAVAIGADNTATGTGAVAIGSGNSAAAVGAVAIGNGASAAQSNAVALGSGSVTSRSGEVALGGANSSVRVGDIAASTAAQSGDTDVVTVDANGTLGRDTTIRPAIASLETASAVQGGQITALQAMDADQNARIDQLQQRQDSLAGDVVRNNRAANAGIAAAMAMSGVIMPADARMAVSFNLATYRGQQGFSGSAAVRAGRHVYVTAGAAGSTVGGSTGARAGVTFAW